MLTNFLILLRTLLFKYFLICDYLEVKLDSVNKSSLLINKFNSYL